MPTRSAVVVARSWRPPVSGECRAARGLTWTPCHCQAATVGCLGLPPGAATSGRRVPERSAMSDRVHCGAHTAQDRRLPCCDLRRVRPISSARRPESPPSRPSNTRPSNCRPRRRRGPVSRPSSCRTSPNHDPVRTHAQGFLDQPAQGYLTGAFQIRLARSASRPRRGGGKY